MKVFTLVIFFVALAAAGRTRETEWRTRFSNGVDTSSTQPVSTDTSRSSIATRSSDGFITHSTQQASVATGSSKTPAGSSNGVETSSNEPVSTDTSRFSIATRSTDGFATHSHQPALAAASDSAASMIASDGFTIPSGQPDGIYHHQLLENGTHVHTKIGDIAPNFDWAQGHGWHDMKPTRPKRFSRRGLADGVTCEKNGAGFTLSDINQAAGSLAAMCQRGGEDFVPPNIDVYALSGAVAAYVCNYSKNAQHCLLSEVTNDFAAIQSKCYGTRAGYYYHQAWKKSYGYDRVSTTFCCNTCNPNAYSPYTGGYS